MQEKPRSALAGILWDLCCESLCRCFTLVYGNLLGFFMGPFFGTCLHVETQVTE